MKQKPELEALIDAIHQVRWQIDALTVERLLSQDTNTEEQDCLVSASEHLKKAISELVVPGKVEAGSMRRSQHRLTN
jgi:hypothetical protein